MPTGIHIPRRYRLLTRNGRPDGMSAAEFLKVCRLADRIIDAQAADLSNPEDTGRALMMALEEWADQS